jgi:hypothetical protein
MEKTGQLGADSLRNTLSLVRVVSRKGAELRGLAVQLLTGQGIGGLGGGAVSLTLTCLHYGEFRC